MIKCHFKGNSFTSNWMHIKISKLKKKAKTRPDKHIGHYFYKIICKK